MYIIDTHALLWYLRDSEELSAKAHKIIDNEEQIFTSIASLWEIAIKHSIGKLDLDFFNYADRKPMQRERYFDFADKSCTFG